MSLPSSSDDMVMGLSKSLGSACRPNIDIRSRRVMGLLSDMVIIFPIGYSFCLKNVDCFFGFVVGVSFHFYFPFKKVSKTF